MKEAFIEKRFNRSSWNIIDNANEILAEYVAKGYVVTLRQLYYQFVSRDLVPNTMKEYKRILSVLNDARLAGHIDWEGIEDRTRNLMSVAEYDDPTSFLTAQMNQYAEPLWEDQPYYCEVWVEKDALVGVIERPCITLRVPFFACRGYTSQSEMYGAGKRLESKLRQGKRVVVFHLGDHDPSGMDMSRDNLDRMNMFCRGRKGLEVRRIALNMDQVEEYTPPPNPAKFTDSRAEGYVAQYGDESWELDALSPDVIAALVTENVRSIMDRPLFDAALAKESAQRKNLKLIADYYEAAVNGAAIAEHNDIHGN